MKKLLLLLILIVSILSCKRYDNYEYCLSCKVTDRNTGNTITTWHPCYAQLSLAGKYSNETMLQRDYPNDSVFCETKY